MIGSKAVSNYILQLNSVAKTYIGGYTAIGYASMRVARGGRYTILGKGMSGKTTLLSLIAGLEQVSQGEILIDGSADVSIQNSSVGYYTTAQMPRRKSVFSIIEYPLKLRNIDNCADKVHSVAEQFGIDNLLKQCIKDLNAMQLVLVALARLFVIKRDIYLLDNPLWQLPEADRCVVINDVINAIAKVDGAVIIATDSAREASRLGFCDNAVLAYSALSRTDTLASLRNQPESIAMAEIMSDSNYDVITLQRVDKEFCYNDILIQISPLIGEFSNIAIALYPSDYLINQGIFSGEVVEIRHTLEGSLACVKIGNDILHMYAEAQVGDTLSFGIWANKVFDAQCEQRITKV